MPGLHARPIVNAEHRIDGEAFEKLIRDHGLGSCAAFFGRLEDEDNSAIELAVLGEMLGRAEQHRGVSVVAAGVHTPGMGRTVLERVDFLNRERIHIGA